MENNLSKAYAEVLLILSYMEQKYIDTIPKEWKVQSLHIAPQLLAVHKKAISTTIPIKTLDPGHYLKDLSYSEICSITDTVESSEYCGVVSSYQGKTLTQIIYTKGGTKHLIGLLKSGKLEIDRNVLEDLSKNAFNDIEEKCYGILISAIDDIELKKEQYDAWIKQQMDEDYIREANRQFNDMMNDFDAWENID